MEDNLRLSLPERKTPATPQVPRLLVLLLCGVLLVGVANLAVSLYRLRGGGELAAGGDLTYAQLEELALRLEKQGLGESAAQTWREYLARPGVDAAQQAKIWYRVGKLNQEASRYEQALAAYYRSEGLARVPELAPEISRRVQESLEAMGKFSAQRQELADRVEMSAGGGKGGDDVVLAEIGDKKITRAEVDAFLEEIVDNQLAAMAPLLPDEERVARKQEMLKRFSTGTDRQQLVGQMVAEEMLYRQAGEDNLAADPAVRKAMTAAQRAILAQQVLAREMASQIKISQSDLQNYFDAHKEEFVEKGEKDKPDRPLSFDEARQQVYQALRSQKEKEAREALFNRLKDRYHVVVHAAQLRPDAGQAAAGDDQPSGAAKGNSKQ